MVSVSPRLLPFSASLIQEKPSERKSLNEYISGTAGEDVSYPRAIARRQSVHTISLLWGVYDKKFK